jgi:hypothetical protein
MNREAIQEDHSKADEGEDFPHAPSLPPYYIRYYILQAVRRFLFAAPNLPSKEFNPNTSPPPPDYNLLTSWFSHPLHATTTESDFVPSGTPQIPRAKRQVDCFFLHPTSFWGRSWNQNLAQPSPQDKAAIELSKYWTHSTQASAFNGSCRVWSPMYRQATVLGLDNEMVRAVAYEDCRQAFLHFLNHIEPDAPFILASHSQGGYHLGMLLEEMVDKDLRLAKRLVCAYLVGSRYPLSRFRTKLTVLRPGVAPDQINCIVGWDTVSDNTNPLTRFMIPHHHTLQINPITWTTTTASIGKGKGWKGAINTTMHRNGAPATTPDWNAFFTSKPLNYETTGLVNIDIPNFSATVDPIVGIVVPRIDRKYLGPCASINWALQGWYHCKWNLCTRV